jgi:hypothetical protein
VLVGIGILVEVARRLGMGFITARAEMEEGRGRERGAMTEMSRRFRERVEREYRPGDRPLPSRR